MTVCQWADFLGWKRGLLIKRFSSGWSVKDAFLTPPSFSNSRMRKTKKVICVETGIVFNSLEEAARFVGKSASNISIALQKKTRTSGGYHWEYADEGQAG